MIARYWRGVTKAQDHGAYLEYLRRTGVADIRKLDGNLGVHLLHRKNGDQAEFLFISLWDSFDSIRSFSGPRVETAVYYPEDRKFLLELTPEVIHYEAETFGMPRSAKAGTPFRAR